MKLKLTQLEKKHKDAKEIKSKNQTKNSDNVKKVYQL